MEKKCKLDFCDRVGRVVQGLCASHYAQFRRSKPLRPFDSRYQTKSVGKNSCRFVGCSRKATAKTLCDSHYKQQNLGKELTPLLERGERGRGTITNRGYKLVLAAEHPNSYRGRILEHRLVMSEYLGRPLLPEENVHHINGNRLDNRLENLELWSKSQPWGQRVSDKVGWALEILRLYAPENLVDLDT